MERGKVLAVLGPTNTGKTHLAVERLCAHSSGIMGFPLRLLAREVYDRVVRIKGPREVGLITGEEKILPEGARWLLCTAESMPLEREAAFVALDEAQLGADPERGHVFTDRLLNARGREETMILGSDTLAPVLRSLVPEAEIVRRPRFSTLSYAGSKKLSRLPKRSAIVAFSAEEVYAVAEMLRRTRGGAAVVMGALSPRTRNAQVAMFQAGEVDYLVATDAIGMGLNMDVAHVAFAGLSKFDGRRQRRLTVAEMAQIAGRAGRHQRDGTFGTLGAEEGAKAFLPEEIEAIEAHRFPRLEGLHWRRGDIDLSSVDALVASLEEKPEHERLWTAPTAVDLQVLKLLADDPTVRERTRGQQSVRRLWQACSLPDFRKLGVDQHARLVMRVFGHLTESVGRIPDRWIAEELARLDRVDGDVEQLGGRIAAARTWAYVAHRGDWVVDPRHWAGVSEALEEKLSDALHKKLTERFVDRRTTVLLRELGADPDLLAVDVADDGVVRIEDEVIGRLDGFAFRPEAGARASDRRRLLAVAERRLVKERARRAASLVAAPHGAFSVDAAGILQWEGHEVASLTLGNSIAEPRVALSRALEALPVADRRAVQQRLERWVAQEFERHLQPLLAIAKAAADRNLASRLRAVLVPLIAAGGVMGRQGIEPALALLTPEDRSHLRRLGVTIGTFDLFDPRLLKPGALRWLAVLLQHAPNSLPPPGATVSERPAPGFRRFGRQWVRADVVEKVVRALHDRKRDDGFVPDPALATSIGLTPDSFAAMLGAAGFKQNPAGKWAWKLQRRTRPVPPGKTNPAFAALQGWHNPA